jgi:heme exporter protein D
MLLIGASIGSLIRIIIGAMVLLVISTIGQPVFLLMDIREQKRRDAAFAVLKSKI